ncbi:MAG: ribbon-helix-helix protein, CopG family [Acidimicrobiales bacterium]
MAHPVSVRFSRPEMAERLRAEAAARRESFSSLAEELIDEGLRIRRHPLVGFRDGPTGRRAGLVGGPDIWEVIAGMVGGDVPPGERVDRAVNLYGLRTQQVDAALAYYAAFTEEVQAEIAANVDAAEEAERLWQRQRDLLAG